MERKVAPREIPAAWAGSLTAEVWCEIVQRNRRADAADSFFSRLRRWFLLNRKAIAITMIFWVAVCFWTYSELLAR
jgi:hypothetical protein